MYYCRVVQRDGGIEELSAALIRMALPNRAPAAELVIGQPQWGQPSVTSSPYIMQRDRLPEDHVANHLSYVKRR